MITGFLCFQLVQLFGPTQVREVAIAPITVVFELLGVAQLVVTQRQIWKHYLDTMKVIGNLEGFLTGFHGLFKASHPMVVVGQVAVNLSLFRFSFDGFLQALFHHLNGFFVFFQAVVAVSDFNIEPRQGLWAVLQFLELQ